MSRVSQRDVEKWVEEMPLYVLNRLGDSEVAQHARDLVKEAGRIAHALAEESDDAR